MQARWIAITAIAAALPAGQAIAAQQAGDRSFTISGTGSSDNNFDSTVFGTTAELGWFLSDPLELGVRQSVSVVQAKHADDTWAASTVGFVDWNFGTGEFVPFIGANLGGVYGDGVHDTGTSGLETGLKYYVMNKTFVGFNVQYDWFFDHTNDFDNRFNDGAFFYSIGVGFNF